MITYRATLDVPASTVRLVSRWLLMHRLAHDRRPWQRAATPYVQAVLVLRWFKDATDLRLLARDAQICTATAYRYLHEAIDVIAAHAPDLSDVLAHGGSIEVLTGPTGYPEWVSDVEPGSTHDITAARVHALPALCAAAAQGLPTLTDKRTWKVLERITLDPWRIGAIVAAALVLLHLQRPAQ